MTDRGAASAVEPYSPQRRTALVFTGVGADGAYHAGVLRAIHEAGVKLDVVAGRGVGVLAALFAAIDGAQRLWDEKGFWRADIVRRSYSWRASLRLAAIALALSVALVVLPLTAIAAGLIVFPIDFILKMLGVSAANGVAERYLELAASAFAPGALPTWLPRLVLLVLGIAAGVAAAAAAWRRNDRRHARGGTGWRLLRPPLSSSSLVEHTWAVMWDLLRGAALLKQPARSDLARRYTELLAENIGQPGFRELVVAVHDLDARRDLIFALVGERRRRDLIRRPTTQEAEARRSEVLDLSGVARDHLADAVAGSLAIPVATEAHPLRFAPDAYWRGETHRLCDRPASLVRLIEELTRLDVQQILLVSAVPESPGPHTLARPRLDPRGRLGEYLQSSEAALVRDVLRSLGRGSPRVFTIRPAHNPIGPFDFDGGFDDRSDRRQPLAELMARGYEDAYHQFIEPVVGASGEKVGQASI
jgi:hypothetical protein